MKIVAAKININENIFNQNYKHLIPLIGEAIEKSEGTKIKYYRSSWTFGDIEIFYYDNIKLIKGKIYKLKPNTKDKEWSEELKKPVPSTATLAYESSFIVDIKSEIIIFEENKEISSYAFGFVFSKLCNTIDYRIGILKLKTIPKKSELDEYFKDYNKVFRAEFNVIPANFTSKGSFSDLDSHLKEDAVEEVRMTLLNNKGNINIESGSIFDSWIKYVKYGYGHAKFTLGKISSNKKIKKVKVKTKDIIHQKEIAATEFEKESLKLMNQAKESIQDVNRE